MTTNSGKIPLLMYCLTLAFLTAMSHLALPAADAQEQIGLLTVTGTVRVKGKPFTLLPISQSELMR